MHRTDIVPEQETDGECAPACGKSAHLVPHIICNVVGHLAEEGMQHLGLSEHEPLHVGIVLG